MRVHSCIHQEQGTFTMVDSLLSYPMLLGTFFLALISHLYMRRVVEWCARSRGRPLPPGPMPLPLIGNFLHLCGKVNPWMGFRDLCASHGT